MFLCCIGLLTPYIFLWMYEFLMQESFYFPRLEFEYSKISINYSKLDFYEIIWYTTIFVIVIISLVENVINILVNCQVLYTTYQSF